MFYRKALFLAAVMAVAFLAPSAALAASSADSVLPDLHVTYLLATKVTYATGVVTTTETITIRNASDLALNNVNLSVIPRAVSGTFALSGRVTRDGDVPTVRWTNHTNLAVSLSPALARGETTTLKVPFTLTLHGGTGNFPARFSKTSDILNLGNWFPIISRSHDAYGIGDPQVTESADSITLDLRTAESFTNDQIAAAGTLISSGPRHWVYRIDHARDYALAISPFYSRSSATVGGVRIDVYTVRGSGSYLLGQVKAAVNKYTNWYGRNPYPRFVMAETGPYDFSQEYPGFVLMGRNMVSIQSAIWHETAHLWWYAAVGDDQLTSPWLDEAFAEFSARYALGMSIMSCSTRPIDSSVYDWPAGITTGAWLGCDRYFDTVYQRGAVFLNQVRALMGDSAFFSTLRAYSLTYRFKMTTTETMLDALRSSAGSSIDRLISEYTTN